ncbi:MAG: hypothetical protein COC02_05460 [Rhodospirillaceae bacterium]|nr:MAG: hypothetical protein COC02_05460 [Rhodospirillaceae bacterium]
MGTAAIFFAGFVIGFLIGGEFTRSWIRGKSKIMRNHPHPDAADAALAEAQKEEKADEEEEAPEADESGDDNENNSN